MMVTIAVQVQEDELSVSIVVDRQKKIAVRIKETGLSSQFLSMKLLLLLHLLLLHQHQRIYKFICAWHNIRFQQIT